MSRSPEVEKLVAKAGTVPLTAKEDRALAAEIERLESCLDHMTAWHESALSVAREMSARAEAAEARVKELLARPGPEETWRADAGWARVAELEAQLLDLTPTIKLALDTADLREQNARLREALIELKRNTVEVILPNAKCLTLDLGQLALWSQCVKQVDEALADGKAAPS